MEELKKKFLKLLEEDEEFRYSVVGLLDLDKIMKSIDESIKEIRNLQKQVRDHSKVLEHYGDILEEHTKAIRSLQEEVKRHGDILEEHTKAILGLRGAIEDFGVVIGRTLEDYTRVFIREILIGKGVPVEKLPLRRKILVYDNELIEINIFNEDPLVLGEVTTYLDNAEREINKVLRRVHIIESIYGREVEYIFLSIEVVEAKEMEKLKELAKQHGIQVFYGRISPPISLTRV